MCRPRDGQSFQSGPSPLGVSERPLLGGSATFTPCQQADFRQRARAAAATSRAEQISSNEALRPNQIAVFSEISRALKIGTSGAPGCPSCGRAFHCKIRGSGVELGKGETRTRGSLACLDHGRTGAIGASETQRVFRQVSANFQRDHRIDALRHSGGAERGTGLQASRPFQAAISGSAPARCEPRSSPASSVCAAGTSLRPRAAAGAARHSARR